MPTDSPQIRAYLARLVRVSDYAKAHDVSVTEVYRRIGSGRLEEENIAGMRFVLLAEGETLPAKNQ